MATKKFCDICGKELKGMYENNRLIIEADNRGDYKEDICLGCRTKIEDKIGELEKEHKQKAKEEAKKLKALQKTQKLKNDK